MPEKDPAESIRHYQTKVVEVTAVRVGKDNKKTVRDWGDWQWFNEYGLVVPTPEGDQYANWGDYVIKGPKGEFHVCRAELFDLLYERKK